VARVQPEHVPFASLKHGCDLVMFSLVKISVSQSVTVAHLARLGYLQAAAEARTLKLRRGAARLGGR
jgi:hypothetical protein